MLDFEENFYFYFIFLLRLGYRVEHVYKERRKLITWLKNKHQLTEASFSRSSERKALDKAERSSCVVGNL